METIDYTINDEIVVIGYDGKYKGTEGFIKKDEIYICKGLIQGCAHFQLLVDIGQKTNNFNCGCPHCGKVFSSSIQYSIAQNFKKLDTLVNIDELTEILEKPAFA